MFGVNQRTLVQSKATIVPSSLIENLNLFLSLSYSHIGFIQSQNTLRTCNKMGVGVFLIESKLCLILSLSFHIKIIIFWNNMFKTLCMMTPILSQVPGTPSSLIITLLFLKSRQNKSRFWGLCSLRSATWLDITGQPGEIIFSEWYRVIVGEFSYQFIW